MIRTVVAGAALAGSILWLAPATREMVSDPCGSRPGLLEPDRDLYCVHLAPAPGFEPASGTVALLPDRSPFTLPVTADGRVRYAPVISLSDLPKPSELGDYTQLVAWVTTPQFNPVLRLGTVGEGRNELPAVAVNKMVFVVTAEGPGTSDDWHGPVILRGQAAATRLSPPDMMEFALGSFSDDSWESADSGWIVPPMPAGLQMLPALMRLRPRGQPYWPAVPPEQVPAARPRQLVSLEDGDTLELTAGFVRRTVQGRDYTMYGFNGQVPGPLIEVRQSASITVDFRNEIDWPTTVHWHGLRLDNGSDGVPQVTQDPVEPGERFSYTLRFPDPGIYWYHPHVREEIQQDLGLAGNMMVRSGRPVTDREVVLMLDDLLVASDGPVPYALEGTSHALMGRFGNVLLVNGEPDYSLEVGTGEVVRFFLTNVSNTRTFNLSFPGSRMKVVGGDVGYYARAAWVPSVVVAPAERYVIDVRFDNPGTVPLLNRVQAIDHLKGVFLPQTDTMGTVTVTGQTTATAAGAAFDTLQRDSAVTSDIARFRPLFDREPDRRLVLRMEAEGLPFTVDRLMQLDSAYFPPAEWSGTMPMMNWISSERQVRWILRDPDTGLENMDIDWRFAVGQTVKVRLFNDRHVFHAMQHPIHLHGQRFLVLAVNGVANEDLVWKDTVLLPVGSTVDILLDNTNPGHWMLHCHIAEHLAAGMHTVFTVQ